MIYKFKATARVPHGVTADAVLAELDLVESSYGRKSPEAATDAVLSDPDRYPALRAFGPESPEQAFRDGIRRGITYAVRQIVEDTDGPPVRALFLVAEGEDAEPVWLSLKVIAADSSLRGQLMADLRRDAAAFTQRLESVLAEVERLIG